MTVLTLTKEQIESLRAMHSSEIIRLVCDAALAGDVRAKQLVVDSLKSVKS